MKLEIKKQENKIVTLPKPTLEESVEYLSKEVDNLKLINDMVEESFRNATIQSAYELKKAIESGSLEEIRECAINLFRFMGIRPEHFLDLDRK
jgi:hypothetical protein